MVSIEFSESVSPQAGGLKVLDASGSSVDGGDVSQPTPSSMRVSLNAGLGDGTYVANYKVISPDGHPISGAIVFTVGSGAVADVSGLAEQNDVKLEVLGGAARFLVFAGALLAAGMIFFVGYIHDWADDRAGLIRIARIAAVTALVATVVRLAVQAALATGRGLAAAVDPSVLSTVLGGWVGASVGVLALGLVGVLGASYAPNQEPVAYIGFYAGLVVVGSFVLWGHPTQAPNPWIAMVAEGLHLGVAAVWFGGLVGLTIVLVARPGPVRIAGSPEAGDPGSFTSTVDVVSRFSTSAAWCAAGLIVGGGALAFNELGSFGAITSTSYGRALLVKVGVVAVILAVAGLNRFRLLPRLLVNAAPAGGAVDESSSPSGSHWRALARTVRLEVLGIVVVVALSALLVNLTPGNAGTAPSGPFEQTVDFRGGYVSLEIIDNRPGTNSFHVTFLDSSRRSADPVLSAALELRLPSADLGPIKRDMVKAGAGHFILENVSDLSIAGDWTITLSVRVSEFDSDRVTFQDPIS